MKILITGDFCPSGRVVDLVNTLDKRAVFNDFIEVMDRNDFSITNLECPVESNTTSRIEKIGPVLSTSKKAIKLLREANFNMVTLANNHIRDLGDEGIKNTISALEEEKLLYVGAGSGVKGASETTIVQLKEKRIGVINIAENEFSTLIKDDEYGAHGLDIIENSKKIKEAKEMADFIIVIYHGGHEGYQLPSPRMKKLFRFFIDNGAHAVICHHAHCFSGYEVYEGSPIFYGLGNFVFDWNNVRKKKWNEGYAVELHLGDVVSYNIIPYIQGDDLPGVRLMTDAERKFFFVKLEELNRIISNDNKLFTSFQEFVSSKKLEYEVHLQPYTWRFLRGLYRRKLFPNLLTKSKKIRYLNMIKCESHHDCLLEYLKNN